MRLSRNKTVTCLCSVDKRENVAGFLLALAAESISDVGGSVIDRKWLWVSKLDTSRGARDELHQSYVRDRRFDQRMKLSGTTWFEELGGLQITVHISLHLAGQGIDLVG